MPRNQKCFIHGTLIEVTFRAENGLPLPATPYIRCLLESVLARAQTLYYTRIVALVTMGNHIHMMLIVTCPTNTKEFVRYVKAETAHAINKLLGRSKQTVWCEGYDSPIILDAEKAIERLVYIYTNPQRANLVETIDEYPNYTTWEAFLNGEDLVSISRIPRSSIPELPKNSISLEEQERISHFLQYSGRETSILHIEPDAWIECFPELSPEDQDGLREQIVSKVRETEEVLRSKRTSGVIGAHALRLQGMRCAFRPKSFGIRTICLSHCGKARQSFITWFKEQQSLAKSAFAKLPLGDIKCIPPGFFLPGGLLIANILPLAVNQVL